MAPTSDEMITFTVSVFQNTIRSNALRLQHAARDREHTHDLLQKGLGRDTRRGELIVDGVMRVFAALEETAVEFNENYPDDLCTTADFGDILLSAIRTLQKA